MGYVKQLLQKLDSCPVTDKQKTVLYKVGVCPRLSWLLMLEELPISWISSTVEAMATKYLKKWTGLAASANTSLLYLSRKKGGLNLPALSTVFKKVQVSRAAQLLQAEDSCVRFLAERKLQADVGLKRRKFLPTVVVRDCMIEDPGRPRRVLMKYVKHEVERVDDETRGDVLVHLERQGQMMKEIYSSPSAAEIWATVVELLPPRISRFALNAAVDTLPHGANLHMWKKKSDDKCPLCGGRQTLIHVLNACPRALQLRRYNERHDQILKILAGMIRKSLPSGYHCIVDLGEESYAFPCHIVSTDVRPDMVWWSDTSKKICFMELTVCFETSFAAAAARKQLRYAELVEDTKKAGYIVKLFTVEVGSRGGIMTGVLKPLVDELKWGSRPVKSLMTDIGRIAIAESYKVWCSRNHEATTDSDSN